MVATLKINEKIKNENDLLNKYDKVLEKFAEFKSDYIEDVLVSKFYKTCFEEKMLPKEFFERYELDVDQKQFIENAKKIIKDEMFKYYTELQDNIKLVSLFKYKKYDFQTVEQMREFIDILKREHVNISYKIYQPENGFSKEDIANLFDLSSIIDVDFRVIETYDKAELSEDEVSLNRAIQAYQEMDEMVEYIESLNLSPFEKFLFVHDFAANKVYKEEESKDFFDRAKSRSFINSMTNDYIVCVGYANIVKAFCDRLGIECMCISGYPIHDKVIGHMANIVKIIDKKYKINGYYFCDTSWDSKRSSADTTNNYFYSALPIQDIHKIRQSKYFSHNLENLNIPLFSKPISVKKYYDALINLYSQINVANFDEKKIKKDLLFTIAEARFSCEMSSENAFMNEYISKYGNDMIL